MMLSCFAVNSVLCSELNKAGDIVFNDDKKVGKLFRLRSLLRRLSHCRAKASDVYFTGAD